jgi:hypothetical protein
MYAMSCLEANMVWLDGAYPGSHTECVVLVREVELFLHFRNDT